MCSYSMVMDFYADKWRWRAMDTPALGGITQEELNDLRALNPPPREGERWLNGREDCELEEKKETLRKLAQQLGVEIVFP